MWVQWLVKGVPDAPKSDEAVRARVQGLLQDAEQRGDWETGLAELSRLDPARALKLSRNDWYRLSRYLEITLAMEGTVSEPQQLTNARVPPLEGLDIRGFFVSEER